MGKLYFLCGIARSGKSTIAKQWVRGEATICGGTLSIHTRKPLWNPRVILCRDQIRLALGHRWNSYAEGLVAGVAETATRALLIDHDVLLDETHTTKNSIIRAFTFDPQAEFYFVNEYPETCKLRAKDTNQEDLYPVIDRMFNNLCNLANMDTKEGLQVLVSDFTGFSAVISSAVESLRDIGKKNKELEIISD